MKILSLLLLSLFSVNVFATSGIDCTSKGSTLELWTVEGDSVVELAVLAPWIQKEPIRFEKIKGEVEVTYDGEITYMASNVKNQSVTLNIKGPGGVKPSVGTLYLRWNNQIYIENMVCGGPGTEL